MRHPRRRETRAQPGRARATVDIQTASALRIRLICRGDYETVRRRIGTGEVDQDVGRFVRDFSRGAVHVEGADGVGIVGGEDGVVLAGFVAVGGDDPVLDGGGEGS